MIKGLYKGFSKNILLAVWTSVGRLPGLTIRRHYDKETGLWYFSVVDIIRILIQQTNHQKARKYWNKLKERFKKEGNESVTNCHQLKLEASDGKKVISKKNYLLNSKI